MPGAAAERALRPSTEHPEVSLGAGGLAIDGESVSPLGGLAKVRTVHCIESERVAPAVMRSRAFAEKERDATADLEGHTGEKVVEALELAAVRARLDVISCPEPSLVFTRTLARAKDVIAG